MGRCVDCEDTRGNFLGGQEYLDLGRGYICIKFHWAVHSRFLHFNVYKECLNWRRKKSKSPYWIYFWYRLAIQVKIMLTTKILLLLGVEIYFWIYSTSLNTHTSNPSASSLWIQILLRFNANLLDLSTYSIPKCYLFYRLTLIISSQIY